MSSKAKEIMEDNMSDAIYDNITGGYSGSIEGYNKATEQCVMVANEYAKEIAIGFKKWIDKNYFRYIDDVAKDEDVSYHSKKEPFEYQYNPCRPYTIEQLFNLYLQSLNQ